MVNGTNTMTSGLATAYMGQIISQFNQTWLGVEHKGITIESRTWYNENQQSSWTFLTGLVILISMTQVIMLGGLSVAREREQGTFDQLLVTPVSSMQILIAKSIPPMIIGLFQSTVLLLIAMFWFKVPFRGNIFLVYAVLFTFISSSIGLGLSISAIAKNMQQVLVYVFVFLFPLALLSGLITPVHNMPKILQYLTYGNPMRFSVDAMRRIYLEGAGLTDIWFNFIPMIILIIISMSIAGWLFRNRVG
ncbi:MAG: ABC transporter permease [Veillonella parvula]